MNDPALRNDRELFEAVAAGDPQAFAELAGRHARGLYDFALRGTLDEQQAAAAVDAVFRRIREPGADAPSQIDFRTWLYSLGLVEVLAVSNEARTARISTDDERFFKRTADVDLEVAHSAWQSARGLRTRDYCVLDLTLRRGLTPEEVAEAASLTRSNLYASIGRARGAFEETFAAMLLFDHGRDACPELDEMVEGAPGTSLRPALRHQIIEHADDCDACRLTLDALPPAAGVYVSLEDVEIPEAVVRRLLQTAPVESAEVQRTQTLVTPVPLEAPEAEEMLNEQPLPVSADEVPPEEYPTEPEDVPVEAPAEALRSDWDTDEGEDIAPAAVVMPSNLFEPVTPASEAEPAEASVQPQTLRERAESWLAALNRQPLIWTYALLGVAVVLAIYLGFAVASSLRGGGGDSGAVPLDTAPGVTAGRSIDCGDTPIELNAGESIVASFDENELDGYSIQTLSFAPVSSSAKFEDLEATLESPFSIRFAAKPQQTTEARTETFELRIQWQRGNQTANSACPLLVHVSPS